jgi:prepilin-type processing-associated H-X9-DG protein
VPGIDKLVEGLTPKIDGNQLTVDLEPAQVDDLVGGTLVKAMFKARASAMRVASMSNMQQLLMATIMYSNDHAGAWPEKLEDLKQYLGGNAQTFKMITTNPARPNQSPAYVYVKPAAKVADVKDPGSKPVMYEAGDDQDQVSVGYADGHVEMLTRARFEQIKPVPAK